MRTVFGDTFYFIALLSATDKAHGRAHSFAQTYSGHLLTTPWVLSELAGNMRGTQARAAFVRLFDQLRARSDVTIVPCDDALFEAGIELYRRRLDKQWSLTDCTSFVVMQREGLTEALTGDHHFEQAGFVALLK